MTALTKPALPYSAAESVYKEITSRSGRYYYFLGSVVEWSDPLVANTPIDTPEYERTTRENIVIVKEIRPSDVAFVVNRVDWSSNTVFDMYDDTYSSQLAGINLTNGGSQYTSNANIIISGGGGAGAKANLIITDGIVTGVTMSDYGSGYTTAPNVAIYDALGAGAVVTPVLNYAYSGAANLQSSNFYVLTDDFNVYKCLDNNNDSPSTVKPVDIKYEAFTLADNYKWKFIATIPNYLKNKFLTDFQFPIFNSINSQFYSRGEIKNVNVTSTGMGYSFARIIVTRDGYREDDPYILTGFTKINEGSGYSSATVTIDSPISGGVAWTANTNVSIGQIINHNKNQYEIVLAGTTTSFGPVHTSGIVSNGTAGLKYRGTGITASANILGGNVVGLTNIFAFINEIAVSGGGSGYILSPNVNISGGGGGNVNAQAVLTNNTISRIVVYNRGDSFSSTPIVTLGDQWTSNTLYSLNTQVFNGSYIYTVTTAGWSNTSAPVHVGGTAISGNAAFTFAGIKATAVASIKYGAGYTKTPNIIITGNGGNASFKFNSEKSEAIILPVIENNKITRVVVEDGGIGYTYAKLTVVGDGQDARFDVSFTQGDFDSIQSNSELLAPAGAIHAIKVISGGYGYGNVAVTITGDGVGATANATVINGVLTKINMISEGTGYTRANVILTDVENVGAGGYARAVISPYGGHGKFPTQELFAKALAFYSTIGQEANQGLPISNEYRQFGVIKNLRNYYNTRYFNNDTGTGCWLLSANINSSLFTEDTIVTRQGDSAKFIIITSTNTGILVLPLDGKIPVVNDVLSEPGGNNTIITGIAVPDIDKYSGDLLYIDNRLAFTTSSDQTISLKTVINY